MKYKCKIIFTTRSRFEVGQTYELCEIDNIETPLDLSAKLYPETINNREIVTQIIETVHRHTLAVELAARLLQSGISEPCDVLRKLSEQSVNPDAEDKIKINITYNLNGVKISEKIIPDDMRWTNADAAKAAGFVLGSPYKNGNKLSGRTGKAQWVTIHNTEDLKQTLGDAERYTLATYNQAMGSCRPHFYIDETSVWQLLKAGTAKVRRLLK